MRLLTPNNNVIEGTPQEIFELLELSKSGKLALPPANPVAGAKVTLTVTEKGKVKCPDCNEIFSERGLRRHSAIHKGKKKNQ